MLEKIFNNEEFFFLCVLFLLSICCWGFWQVVFFLLQHITLGWV